MMIHRLLEKTFAVSLVAFLVGATGCDTTVEPQAGAHQEEASAFDGKVLSRSQLAAAFNITDRAHWADGYTRSHDPAAASSTPAANYSFNRLGNAIQIEKPAATTGRYVVQFAGLSALLGTRSTVQVTGYGADDHYCKAASASLVNDLVEVRCFQASTRAAIDSRFSILVTRNYNDHAFMYAHRPSADDYAPRASASWNPAGAMRVHRNAVGTYHLVFTGLGSRLTNSGSGGHVQVTAVGTGKQNCKVSSWGHSTDAIANVRCYNAGGALVDAEFNVLFLLPSEHVAYAWGNAPSSLSYEPHPFYSFNPTGGATSVTRLGTGRYSISWTGVDPVIFGRGNVQVTAYGGSNEQCKVTGWTNESANVRCFKPNGTLVDALYTVLLGS